MGDTTNFTNPMQQLQAQITALEGTLLLTQSTQTASYTLALGDENTLIDMNSASALNLTIPPNSSVPLDIGAVIEICQYGAGQVTVVAGGGVTIHTSSSFTTRAQYSTISMRQKTSNLWILSGDLT